MLASGAGVALTGAALTFRANSKEAPAGLDKYKPEYLNADVFIVGSSVQAKKQGKVVMEELATNSKIIRPAYKTLCTDQPYVELSERK